MFFRPFPEHHRAKLLDVVIAVMVVQHNHGYEEKFFAKVVGPEDFGECFPDLLCRIVERTRTYR